MRCNPRGEGAGVPAVGPNFGQARKLPLHLLEEGLGPVAFAQVGGRNKNRQDQTAGVYQQVTLASFDMLVTVETDVVLTGLPPFSVVFTD